MKKVYSLLGLLLFFFSNAAYAQLGWEYEEKNVEEIIGGEEHVYLIRQGYGPASENKFLAGIGSESVSNVQGHCGFYFIQDGEVESPGTGEVFPVYVLKNVETGLYLVNSGELYTASKKDAFHFTARKAKEYPTEGDVVSDDWDIYSNGVDARSNPAADEGMWVFCKYDSKVYMTHLGNPAFYSYTDVNNWMVFEAHERELTAYEKLNTIYERYFKDPVEPEIYPYGENPGNISKELFDRMKAVYDESSEMVGNPDLEDAEYDRVREEILAVFNEYETSVVPFSPGYYLLRNERKAGLYYDNGMPTIEFDVENPTEWNIENARYIWQVTAASEDAEEYNKYGDGKYHVQNFLTGNYMSQDDNSDFRVVTGPNESTITSEYYGKGYFLLYDKTNMLNQGNDDMLTHWSERDQNGCHFRWVKVPEDVIAELYDEVMQNQRNTKAKQLVNSIEASMKSIQTKNGFTEDGSYGANAVGLTSELLAANASDPTEGAHPEYMFDGDLNTFYHTSWHAELAPEGYHWIMLDLGEEVSDVVIKFSKRANNNNGNPAKFTIYTNEEGDPDVPAEGWNIELAKADTVIYGYASKYGSTLVDSTTYIGKFTFNMPARYIRFEVTETPYHQMNNKVSGPMWHVSELRFYKAEDCGPNPVLDLIPAAIKDELNRALEVVKSELEAGNVSEASYDALVAAEEAFWEAYPDQDIIPAALDAAQKLIDAADETQEELGYFKPGAKDALQKEVDAIRLEIEDKTLTLEQISTYQDRLNTALDAFYAMLIVPEAGQVYRIVNNGQPEEETQQTGSFVASANADIAGAPVWGYKEDADITTRWNTLWLMERNDEGRVAFKNLANGLYLGNFYEGLTEEEQDEVAAATELDYSETPQYFRLLPGAYPGSFLVEMREGWSINTAPSGKMVAWLDREDPNNQFTFQVVTDDDFSESYMIDCTENAPQVITLPIALTGVYSLGGSAYKVLGRNGDMLQLDVYGDDEEIPAGTPFVIVTEEDETMVEAVPVAASLEELQQSEYVYEIKEQNGLVSAPRYREPGEGFGLFTSNGIEISTKDDGVAAGTGYLNNSIPETSEEGSYSLVINGDITGIGTSISDGVIVKNGRVDVYTLAGVKVRSNVKVTDAVKNLPKGIYLVGSKKVLVP